MKNPRDDLDWDGELDIADPPDLVGSILARIQRLSAGTVIAILFSVFITVLYCVSTASLAWGPLLIPIWFFATPAGAVSLGAGLWTWRWGGKGQGTGDPKAARVVLVFTSPLIAACLSFPVIGVFENREKHDARAYIEACIELLDAHHAEHGTYPESLDLLDGRPDEPRLVKDGGVRYTVSGDEFKVHLAGRFGWAMETIHDSKHENLGSSESSGERGGK